MKKFSRKFRIETWKIIRYWSNHLSCFYSSFLFLFHYFPSEYPEINSNGKFPHDVAHTPLFVVVKGDGFIRSNELWGKHIKASPIWPGVPEKSSWQQSYCTPPGASELSKIVSIKGHSSLKFPSIFVCLLSFMEIIAVLLLCASSNAAIFWLTSSIFWSTRSSPPEAIIYWKFTIDFVFSLDLNTLVWR